MYNAVTKLIVLSSIFLFVACGNSDREKAEQLLVYAQDAIVAKNHVLAIELLDSIEKSYPAQVDVRRKALHVRPKAIEGATLKELEQNDSIIATLQLRYSELSPNFETINDKRLVEPYIVAKKASKSLFEKTGIQARITTDGEFYMISSLVGDPIKHTSISLIAGSNEVTTSNISYDGDRNYRSGNTEIITFVKPECDTLGVFAKNNEGKSFKLRFNGKRNKTINLNKNEINTFAMTYEYASLIYDLKKAFRRKEFLNQQLLLARDQIARTLDDTMIETNSK